MHHLKMEDDRAVNILSHICPPKPGRQGKEHINQRSSQEELQRSTVHVGESVDTTSISCALCKSFPSKKTEKRKQHEICSLQRAVRVEGHGMYVEQVAPVKTKPFGL
ncbi:hypothetical protein AMECASPLE_030157 [Ameca splendens]|uniref:Uncharacterized protein n=1 Tax=Ameca splendens TaxID=208324 RepID=A0ABV0Y665_9TELE